MLLEREDQLRMIGELAAQADRGCGCTVLLSGEAGIGKTALLQAFAAQQEATREVLWGACEPLSTPRPLGPLQDMAAALDPGLPTLLEQGATPSSIFARVLAALQTTLPARALIFEDVHWADQATLDLIRFLGRRLPAVPTLLILSLRSDEVAPGDALATLAGDLPATALVRVMLTPLTAAAVGTLAQQSGRDGDEVYRVTAGNPFFVNMLLTAGDGIDGALPVTVRDVVWARLARLDAQERWVLDLIGMIPGSVEHGLWAALRAEDVAAAERCVARGILVRGAAGALAFRHELVRQAVLAQMTPEAQRLMHAHVLALLERRARSAVVPLARLVHHAVAAEDARRVLVLAPRAAAEAAALGAHRLAAQQLEWALRFVAQASDVEVAQLYQDWAYEMGLAVRITDAVIAARHQAIEIWRRLGCPEKVGHNLRWLSRLHWYRGDGKQAEEYADAAVRELAALPPGSELAMAYSVRSQLHMLHDRFGLAIEWGERALALAEQTGDVETRMHALNNIGVSQLMGEKHDPAGRAKLEQSLQLGRAHGYDEHTARAYTNLAEYAVVFKDYPLAERVLADGIAFDRQHDLDVWTNYLVGWQAQLRLAQGRLHEAESVAQHIVMMATQSVIERLPAMSVLGRARARLGVPGAVNVLREALQLALPTAEPQRVVPLHLALVEAAWIEQDLTGCDAQLEALEALTDASLDLWEYGELAVWRQRRQLPSATRTRPARQIPEPWAAELRGDPLAAAAAWLQLGAPCEAALALLQVRDAGAGAAFTQALRLLDPLDAQGLLVRMRGLALELGVDAALPGRRRGRYSVARTNALGLTRRELQVLELLHAGQGTPGIAQRLSRSPRTVEHHVAGIYVKLGVNNRVELLLRLHHEPWLLHGSPSGP
jgi:DNA-binding CsgD family transcriptional regulator/tetratricopeptide (TPR) repeat protein